MPAILALDIGTSSVRSAIFEASGELRATTLSQASCQLLTATDGRAEMDADGLLKIVRRCLLSTQKHGADVLAVGVSCYWHSLLGTDSEGRPLTPIYTWADFRCREDAAALRAELSEKSVHAETGCMLRTSFWPAKLRWIRRTKPALFRRVKRWMSPAEWLQLQITGSTTCAHGMATGTGLYDPKTMTWSPRMLEVTGLRASQLNEISDRPSTWRGTSWYPAIGDGAASNLGSDATGPGTAAINVGTSAAVRVVRNSGPVRAPFGLFCYRIDQTRFLIGGAVSNAGSLHAWSLRELRVTQNPESLEEELARRPTPKHGLLVLPFWSAERAPEWNEHSRGSIHGITHATSAIDILQAVTEAFHFRIARIADLVADGPNGRWIVSGGILHSPTAIQRLANVMGRTLHPNPEREASLRGAAIFAMEKSHLKPTDAPLRRRILPSKKVHTLYLAERAKADALAQRLS
ncbi:MAG: gluconokinase [Terrimicrobiaceae bacterium]